MKIAITSPNGKTVSGHAGKCPGFLIYQTGNKDIEFLEHLKIVKEMVFSSYQSEVEHPLNDIDVLITKGCGAGMINKMNKNGIDLFITDENDPDIALRTYLNQI